MKKRVAKRALLAAWMAALALLMSGCAVEMTAREMADLSDVPIEAGVSAPLKDGADSYEERFTLYLLSEDGSMLVPVTRKVTVESGKHRAQAALEALLSGPKAGEADAYWPDLGAIKRERLLEISCGVATVDLPSRTRELPQETLYAVRVAIACTLTELGEISYVNVLIGGREEGLDLGATLPVGTLTHVDDLDALARYNRLNEQRLSQSGVTRLCTLYFPTEDKRYLLPEVRSIAFAQAQPIEYLYTLLGEMGKGAGLALCAKDVPAPMEYIEEMPEIVRTQDGYLAIELRFDGVLREALEEANLALDLYMAMLTDTLMGVVPGVEGLQVSIGGQMVASERQTPSGEAAAPALATRDGYAGYIGKTATLYAVKDKGLARVQGVLPLSGGAREKLAALMAENTALPEALTQDDILAVHEGTDVIAVNLSGRAKVALSALTPEQERAAIYAMVNTLTEDAQASRVVFFFVGKQVETLAGALEMRGGFVRNPGMVVN